MKVNREEMLKIFKVARIGTTAKELIEQSDSFIFKEGHIYTFNDEIMVKGPCPLGFDAAVPAGDFENILTKIPDEEIDITLEKEEVIIKGKRKKAGITCLLDIRLPFNTVPKPTDWKKLPQEIEGVLQQAARTCGKDMTQPLSALVHVTPKRIEASDNFRIFRQDIPTGFPGEILLPASSIGTLSNLTLRKVSMGKGWVHFRTRGRQIISIRCNHSKYHKKEDVDRILELKKGKKIILPENLDKIIQRTEVMSDSGYDSQIQVLIKEGKLVVTSRKASGWYEEKKKIDYVGNKIEFFINPNFLVEILQRTKEVKIGDGKLKIQIENIQFVVALNASE